MELYMVGGAVRDEILGIPSKDIDFTVVLPPVEGDPFLAMTNRLKMMGFKIFLETPEFLTVRAQFPPYGFPEYHGRNNLTADFVLARKESEYTDGRRPDKVEVGTLEDDLARRDFTMNAIAKDSAGNYIDPHGGQYDIAHKIIRCVGDPMRRFEEDALRAVRALRFSVTKQFTISAETRYAMQMEFVLDSIRNNIADERIQQELTKMFKHSTLDSLRALNEFPQLTRAMFAGNVSLDATMKTKGFRK